jgi:lysophospholipase L1-like esterase
MTPPPVYVTDNKCQVNQKVVNNYFSKLIPDLAREIGLPEKNIIDVFNALGGRTLELNYCFCDDNTCDGVHPVNAGYYLIAKLVYKTLFDDRFD